MPAFAPDSPVHMPTMAPSKRLIDDGRTSSATATTPESKSMSSEIAEQRDLLVIAAALEFQSTLDLYDDIQAASNVAVSMLVNALPATRVMLLWRSTSQTSLRILADSEGVRQSESHQERRIIVAAAEEVAERGSFAHWPVIPEQANGNRHALLAVGQLANHLRAQRLAGVDLVNHDGQSRGALLVVNADVVTTTQFLHTVASPLTNKLCALERLQANRFETWLRSIIQVFPNRLRTAIGALLFLISIMLVPAPYRVRAPLELRPVGRRFVAVPFAGPLKTSSVRPGDPVQSGDVLATIDPREIDYQLAGVQTELSRAQQDRKGRMAAHEFAATKLADLESERLRLQRDLLQVRRDNLVIRSPINGVIVSGDWKGSEGTPMTRGEVLFEIAPLGNMIVEIEVDESDIAHLRPGMTVDFRLDAFPDRKLTGSLERIQPRTVERNRNYVFIAELPLVDPDHLFRPGMRGGAVIWCERHPIGWNLFHKAYFACRQMVAL